MLISAWPHWLKGGITIVAVVLSLLTPFSSYLFAIFLCIFLIKKKYFSTWLTILLCIAVLFILKYVYMLALLIPFVLIVLPIIPLELIAQKLHKSGMFANGASDLMPEPTAFGFVFLIIFYFIVGSLIWHFVQKRKKRRASLLDATTYKK